MAKSPCVEGSWLDFGNGCCHSCLAGREFPRSPLADGGRNVRGAVIVVAAVDGASEVTREQTVLIGQAGAWDFRDFPEKGVPQARSVCTVAGSEMVADEPGKVSWESGFSRNKPFMTELR